jgi:predicted dinucleotide-binding enzyme
VKGFNTLTAGFLTESAHRAGLDRVVIFLSGDDGDAMRIAGTLVRDAGFDPVALGAVADSARQAPGGSYYGEEFHLADVPALQRI